MIPLWDRNPTRHRPWMTLLLVAVNVAVFVFVQPQSATLDDIRFTYEYAAIPCEVSTGDPLTLPEIELGLRGDNSACGTTATLVGVDDAAEVFPDKRVWLAVLVSMFLHASWLHLGGNMLFLWVFGNNIEDHLGPVRYLGFYLLAGIVASLAHVAVQLDSTVPVVGASGAVAGVMGAYLVWFPTASIVSLVGIIPLPLPAFLTLGFWFVSQFFVGPDAGIAWMAHVGGFVFGATTGLAVRESVVMRQRVWAAEYRSPGATRWDNRHGPLN